MIAQVIFMKADLRLARAGDRRVILGWALHVPAVLVVLGWLSWVGMPVWTYAIAAYGAHSVLKIRTFLEHQAHERASARSVDSQSRKWPSSSCSRTTARPFSRQAVSSASV